MSREEIVRILRHVKMAMSRTEKQAMEEGIDLIENASDVAMAEKILDMIDKNGVNLYDIRNFCVNYITSKREED